MPSTAGTVWPPMPLPASTTTLSGREPDRSTSAAQEAGVVAEQVTLADRADPPGRCGRCVGAVVQQLLGQVADLGQPAVLPHRARACERQSLMPLYGAGLWLAVNIAPGTSSAPLA